MGTTGKTSHSFSAEAHAFKGHIKKPAEHKVEPHVYTTLDGEGGYRFSQERDFSLDGILTMKYAHSQLAGAFDTDKSRHHWSTLVTTVIEGLNVLEVVTADRVIAQFGLNHYKEEGYAPEIFFLGTRFENLCIAGNPVHIEWQQDILGDKPENNATYFDNKDLIARIRDNNDQILKASDLQPSLRDYYNRSNLQLGAAESIECSLVKKIEGDLPGKAIGNSIYIPHFGTLKLATVSLSLAQPHPENQIPQETLVKLTMIDMQMGCIGSGSGPIGEGTGGGG
jgi:hypothetical protein